ncbi:TetR/AcrR family transcriptional regulator, partial [Streptomyces halstedii]|uniref:TetR/AcrR family transcriptional regulator n=2 Tax=Streptomyces TaxID=1883 RepID=UPI00334ED5CF
MAGARKNAPPREEVLAAAMEMIAERGLEKLTMAALGREVGMSSGHLLYYFRTKDELLLRTLEWSEGRLGTERGRLLAARGTARERLDAYVDLYVPEGHRDPHWTLWLEVWNRSQNAAEDARERQVAIEGAWHRDLVALLAEGISRGEFRAVDPDRLAARLRALLDGFSIHVAIGLRG